jgi:ParB-like chromosome segregation protein Spo0J
MTKSAIKLKKIKITCKYEKLLPLEQLKTFQNEFKVISERNIRKLKDSILEYGFSFPIFIWQNNILDGHQRFEAVRQLIEDGFELPDNMLPTVSIDAENEQEAAEKLLLINSQYSRIEQHGFDDFVDQFDVDLDQIGTLIDIPGIDISLPEFDAGSIDEQGDLDKLDPKWILCPHCGEKFDQRELKN